MISRSAFVSDTGRARVRNEDFVWTDPEVGVYVLADGLGGHEAGDRASRLSATTIGERLSRQLRSARPPVSTQAIQCRLAESVEAANRVVRSASARRRHRRRMGAVVVVAVVRDMTAYISHAGDARAYLAHDTTLRSLTVDHSAVAELVAIGRLSPEAAGRHHLRHVVTKVVGQDGFVEPSFAEVGLVPGDRLVLCSDGLWDMVTDEEVSQVLSQTRGEPARAAEQLVSLANAAGGPDNISVIIVDAASQPGVEGELDGPRPC